MGLLNNKKVFVGRFVPRKEREIELGEKAKMFTNVYIKNFNENLSEDDLTEMFSKYGKITSLKLMKTDEEKNKGFGFVSFEEASAAEAACDDLNGKEVSGKTIYVGRAQKKAERQMELKKKFEQMKIERMTRFQGVNLYVKNLDDSITDERLLQEFAPYGTITSAKVMSEEGRSKGFGFVCFSAPEEATKAVTEMNGRIIVSKPLYVALAQRKEDRKAHLATQYMQRVTGLRMQMNQPMGYAQQYYVQAPMQQPQRFFNQGGMPRGGNPRWQGGNPRGQTQMHGGGGMGGQGGFRRCRRHGPGSAKTGKLQVHSGCSEPRSGECGHASARAAPVATGTASGANPGTRASDGLHVGLCPSTGAEADVGRATLPTHPRYVPGTGG